MEQLDKEVIEELSEPAKRVFRSLDYRSQRRMLKKAKEMGKQKKRKTQQKERIKKKSITKKQKKKEALFQKPLSFYISIFFFILSLPEHP